MRRSVTLPLDGFAVECVRGCEENHRLSPDELFALAVSYFLDPDTANRPARLVPRFGRSAESAEALTFELELPAWQWTALEVEAHHQRVAAERLLEHAALLLAADLDSGRVAARIAN